MPTETESVSPATPQRDNALYRAWRARIDRYLDQAFQAMGKDDRVAALSAPDDFWAFFETLVLSPAQASDPERCALLRGEIIRKRMLESRGGCLTAPQLAQVLGISRQAVNQRRLAGTLLGVLDGGRYVYPRCQLDRSGKAILPGLEQTLQILLNTDTDPWTILSNSRWNPHSNKINGLRRSEKILFVNFGRRIRINSHEVSVCGGLPWPGSNCVAR